VQVERDRVGEPETVEQAGEPVGEQRSAAIRGVDVQQAP